MEQTKKYASLVLDKLSAKTVSRDSLSDIANQKLEKIKPSPKIDGKRADATFVFEKIDNIDQNIVFLNKNIVAINKYLQNNSKNLSKLETSLTNNKNAVHAMAQNLDRHFGDLDKKMKNLSSSGFGNGSGRGGSLIGDLAMYEMMKRMVPSLLRVSVPLILGAGAVYGGYRLTKEFEKSVHDTGLNPNKGNVPTNKRELDAQKNAYLGGSAGRWGPSEGSKQSIAMGQINSKDPFLRQQAFERNRAAAFSNLNNSKATKEEDFESRRAKAFSDLTNRLSSIKPSDIVSGISEGAIKAIAPNQNDKFKIQNIIGSIAGSILGQSMAKKLFGGSGGGNSTAAGGAAMGGIGAGAGIGAAGLPMGLGGGGGGGGGMAGGGGGGGATSNNNSPNQGSNAPRFSRNLDDALSTGKFTQQKGSMSSIGEASKAPSNLKGLSSGNVGKGVIDRSSFANEFDKNPGITEKLFNIARAEVGGQGEGAIQKFMETVFNRAHARGVSIDRALDPNYYPDTYNKRYNFNKDEQEKYNRLLSKVRAGSNESNYATDAASGNFGANRMATRGGGMIDNGEYYYTDFQYKNAMEKLRVKTESQLDVDTKKWKKDNSKGVDSSLLGGPTELPKIGNVGSFGSINGDVRTTSYIPGYDPEKQYSPHSSTGNVGSKYVNESFLPAMNWLGSIGMSTAAGENPYVRGNKFSSEGQAGVDPGVHSAGGHHYGAHGYLAADISGGAALRPNFAKLAGGEENSRAIISAFGDLMFHPKMSSMMSPKELINQNRTINSRTGENYGNFGGHPNHVHFAPGNISAEKLEKIRTMLFNNPEEFGEAGKKFADLMTKNGIWVKTENGYSLNPEKFPDLPKSTATPSEPGKFGQANIKTLKVNSDNYGTFKNGNMDSFKLATSQNTSADQFIKQTDNAVQSWQDNTKFIKDNFGGNPLAAIMEQKRRAGQAEYEPSVPKTGDELNSASMTEKLNSEDRERAGTVNHNTAIMNNKKDNEPYKNETVNGADVVGAGASRRLEDVIKGHWNNNSEENDPLTNFRYF